MLGLIRLRVPDEVLPWGWVSQARREGRSAIAGCWQGTLGLVLLRGFLSCTHRLTQPLAFLLVPGLSVGVLGLARGL